MAERKPAKKDTQQSARSAAAINETSEGFTAEERAAMKERARELKAEPDRAMAERLHAIIKAAAPDLSPRTWYGSPAYARDGNVVCFFQDRNKFKTRYRPSASATRRGSTTAPCGRPPAP